MNTTGNSKLKNISMSGPYCATKFWLSGHSILTVTEVGDFTVTNLDCGPWGILVPESWQGLFRHHLPHGSWDLGKRLSSPT